MGKFDMTYYQKEIQRIKEECYSNDWQLRVVIRTKNFIDHNFDKDLKLDLLSHIQWVSKFHLLRLFKKYYGQTPRQYLIDKRVEKSKEYLRNGLTVTQTCFAVGFESPPSFSILFKRRVGKSPRKYQKEQFSISNTKL